MPQSVSNQSQASDRQRQETCAPSQNVSMVPATGRQQTDMETLERYLQELDAGRQKLQRMSVEQRVSVLEQCIDRIAAVASEWVDAACDAKGIANGSPCHAEEVLGGPVATMRQLQLFCRSMRDIARTGSPCLPPIVTSRDGKRCGVRVTPAVGMLDPFVFSNFRATTWLQNEQTRETVATNLAPAYRSLENAATTLVLGAGNVAGIPATDMLSKLCVENRAVLLKMNPVNEYLGPIFERAFAPLVESNLLRIVYGDASVAQHAIADERIADVHVTGSTATHDAIVWGIDGDGERRRASGTPLLQKPITSELGNVSQWIVTPGKYSSGAMRSQVGNIVSSMTNNAAFNCIATRAIITWKQWPERETFLSNIESLLARQPQRKAYYPGAHDRYERFTGMNPAQAKTLLKQNLDSGMCGRSTVTGGPTMFVAGTGCNDDTLPWTLISNVQKNDQSNPLLCSESFVSVCVEIPIDADNPIDFLHKATDFANQQLWGTLAASMTVPNGIKRERRSAAALDECIHRLEYGVVSLNQWAGIAFALMSPPWGGYPGSSLSDIRSGTGWVHNSCMLTGIENTVLEAPLRVIPKPVWSPGHSCPERVAWAMFELMRRPDLLRLSMLGLQASRAGL